MVMVRGGGQREQKSGDGRELVGLGGISQPEPAPADGLFTCCLACFPPRRNARLVKTWSKQKKCLTEYSSNMAYSHYLCGCYCTLNDQLNNGLAPAQLIDTFK